MHALYSCAMPVYVFISDKTDIPASRGILSILACIAQKICINICFATKMTKNLRRNIDSQGKGAGVGAGFRGDEH